MQVEIKKINGQVIKLWAEVYLMEETRIIFNESVYKKEEILYVKIFDRIIYERIRNGEERFSRIEDFYTFVGQKLKVGLVNNDEIKGFEYSTKLPNSSYKMYLYNEKRDFEYWKHFSSLEDMKKFITKFLVGGGHYEN